MSDNTMAQSAADPDGSESKEAVMIFQPDFQVKYLTTEKDIKIYYSAMWYGAIGTSKDAYIFNNAQVHGNVCARDVSIFGNARLTANVSAMNSLTVRETANLSGDVYCKGDASFSMSCRASGRIHVAKNLKLSGTACLSGDVDVDGDLWMCDNARITGDLTLGGQLHTYDNSYVRLYTMSSRNLMMNSSSEPSTDPMQNGDTQRVHVHRPSTNPNSSPQPSHAADEGHSENRSADESVDEEGERSVDEKSDCDTPEDDWRLIGTQVSPEIKW